MKWLYVALAVSAVIAPFDALYLYIKALKRRERLRKEEESAAARGPGSPEGGGQEAEPGNRDAPPP